MHHAPTTRQRSLTRRATAKSQRFGIVIATAKNVPSLPQTCGAHSNEILAIETYGLLEGPVHEVLALVIGDIPPRATRRPVDPGTANCARHALLPKTIKYKGAKEVLEWKARRINSLAFRPEQSSAIQ